MNIDNPSSSNSLSLCTITSKYFTNKIGMDESLLDFQEKKKSCTGPKTTQKPKSRKAIRNIKGQNDIRKILKPKKNGLVSYTKDFNDICRKSGIDVDSEQLQLAIALSKSLQEPEPTSDSNDSQNSEPITLKERTGKIRTTLLEYGFKVPEVKITAPTKRLRKLKKDYKLILITDAERQQIIYDKYTQVLFQNFDNTKEIDSRIEESNNKRLYNLSTNSCYNIMKNNNIFYVDNLLKKSPNTVGCLLKNWAEIPGRPQSPKLFEESIMDFSEIECSQDELDTILSGSLKTAKGVIKTKSNLTKNLTPKGVSNDNELNNCVKPNAHTIKQAVYEDNEKISLDYEMKLEKTSHKSNVLDVLHSQAVCRSISPDIFDDDESTILDNNRDNSKTVTTEVECIVTTNENINFMDLTECVNAVEHKSTVYVNEMPNSQLSQGSNITKRKSNDFMEMTKCVSNFSQPIVENIDLTQTNCNFMQNPVKELNNSIKIIQNENTDITDLTQSSDSNDSNLPIVELSGKKQISLDDTIVLDDQIVENNSIERISIFQINPSDASKVSKENEITIDKTRVSPMKSKENYNNSSNDTNFEEYIYHHSDHSSKEYSEIKIPNLESEEVVTVDHKSDDQSNNIDLTQSSDSSIEKENPTSDIESTKRYDNNSLGKKDDVSIDYDESSNNIEIRDCSINFKTNKSATFDEIDNNRSIITVRNDATKSSPNSEFCEISDEELNYSINKSKCEIVNDNFDLGNVSVINDLLDLQSFNKTTRNSAQNNNLQRSMSDSFLPIVKVKDIKTKEMSPTKLCRSKPTTPIKQDLNNDKIITVETPKNSKYIIKTDQVTPMLDYESMSTPEMNKELDKYGLKPFKRKRAIQLLTHLYNQTHPFIESYTNEEQPSPSKRRKQTDNNFVSPSISPKKKPEAPEYSLGVLDKENDLYKVTNEIPEIKEVECNSEDWVFQKREKSKVHSCRVPLHIAFHNYVSSRRGLREAILRYEPLDIDAIHKGLIGEGHKYNPKDLLKFLDKKCITVKTGDNNSRNKRC